LEEVLDEDGVMIIELPYRVFRRIEGIQDSRFKIQDSRFKIQDSRFKIQDSRCLIEFFVELRVFKAMSRDELEKSIQSEDRGVTTDVIGGG